MSQKTKFHCCVNNASTLTLNCSSDIYPRIASELKELGIKIPKFKKSKYGDNKQDRGVEADLQIFGVSLADLEWVSDSGWFLPRFLLEATTYLNDYIQVEIGLFRKSGSVARQRRLREKLESGGSFDGCEPNDVASLLKQWLRELPEPLIPSYLHEAFVKSISLSSESDCLSAILLGCLLLPAEHLYTLKSLLKFLAGIAAHSAVNKMGPYNLALIMVPNLFTSVREKPDGSGGGTVKLYTRLIELLIEHYERVGELPEKWKFQLEMKAAESSDDIFDSSSVAATKKQRGAVSDVVNSIKKLVGGGSSSAEQLNGSSALSRTPSRFANKRKAEPDLHISHLKKIAISQTQSAMPRVGTPFKDVLTPSLTPSQNKRRSFGILKKKNKKKKTDPSKCNGQVNQSSGASPKLVTKVEEPTEHFLCVPQVLTAHCEGKTTVAVDSSSASPLTSPNEQKGSPFKRSSKSHLKFQTAKIPAVNVPNSPKLPGKKLDTLSGIQVANSNFRRVGSIRRSSRRRPRINTPISANSQRITRTSSHNRSFRRAALQAKMCNISLPNAFEVNDNALTSPCLEESKDEIGALESVNDSVIFKRNYKSSLKRGRPNTLKTGLKTKKSSDSVASKDGVLSDSTVEVNDQKQCSEDKMSVLPQSHNDSMWNDNVTKNTLEISPSKNDLQEAVSDEPFIDESPKITENSTDCDNVKEQETNKSCDVIITPSDDRIWYKEEIFINQLSIPKETSKRDSIVQILANNAGKVQANVQHFNCISNKPRVDLSGPQTAFKSPYTPVKANSKCGSASRSSSSSKMAKYRKSPLPLPPKFSVADINSPSPLKEVTNLNSSLDSLRVSPGITATKRKLPPIDCSNKDKVPKKSTKAHRSESSPARPFHRKCTLDRGSSENVQPVRKGKLHSHSFNGKATRSDFLATRTKSNFTKNDIIEDE